MFTTRKLKPGMTKQNDDSLSRVDLALISFCAATGLYITVTTPVFIAILGCTSLVFWSLATTLKMVPGLEKYYRRRIRFWHLATVIITLTAVLGVLPQPASAIFLQNLQTFLEALAEDAGVQEGSEAIAAAFNAIRAVFLLLVGAAALFAYNQAQQGNDWRPIITQIGIAFGIVLTIDVITWLFIGNNQGQLSELLSPSPLSLLYLNFLG